MSLLTVVEPVALDTPLVGNLILTQPLPPDQLPALVYLSQLGTSSRRTMRHGLDTIAHILTCNIADALMLNWGQVRFQHTAAVRSVLMELYAISTANRMLAAMRKTLHTAWYLGQLDAESYQRAISVKDIKGDRLPAGRALRDAEVAALLRVCAEDAKPAGIRDAAIFAVLSAGLRRSEVVTLKTKNYDSSTDGIEVLGGKGNKDRVTYLPPGGGELMQAWLELRGAARGALFYPVNKGGAIVRQDEPMNDQVIMNMLKKRVAAAQIKDCSPHDFRRTFISNLLDAGVDIVTVQRLVGHSDPSTTAKYDRRAEEAKRSAVKRLMFPSRAAA